MASSKTKARIIIGTSIADIFAALRYRLDMGLLSLGNHPQYFYVEKNYSH
jgi:hypothetical protein